MIGESEESIILVTNENFCARLLITHLNKKQKKRADLCYQVAVGISIARHPPHRPVRALLTHTVLTLDIWRRSAQWDMGGEHESQEANGPDAP